MFHFFKKDNKHNSKKVKKYNNVFIIRNNAGKNTKYYKRNLDLVQTNYHHIMNNHAFYFSKLELEHFSQKMTKTFGTSWKKSIKFINLSHFIAINTVRYPKPSCSFVGRDQNGTHFMNPSENNIDYNFKIINLIRRFQAKYDLPNKANQHLNNLKDGIILLNDNAYMDYPVRAVNLRYVEQELNFCKRITILYNN